MNDVKTIIEQSISMDIDDPKNSWYLDAEKFDINFPYIYTYRHTFYGLRLEKFRLCRFDIFDPEYNQVRFEAICLEKFKRQYDFFHSITAYFSLSQQHSAFIFESKSPNILNPSKDNLIIGGTFDENVNKSFSFYVTENMNGIEYFRYIIVAPIASLSEFKSRLFVSRYSHPDTKFGSGNYYNDSNVIPDIVPFLQIITTKDWDLVKRYLFFMVRNHQYKESSIGFSKLPELYINNRVPDFVGGLRESYIMDDVTKNLPSDYRFNFDSDICDISVHYFENLPNYEKA